MLLASGSDIMGERFERHKQPWTSEELHKLHLLAGKGHSLRAIAKALTRTEESVKLRARADGLKITALH
jgi:DNA-binding NarL/FixJ family response regulator